MPITDLLVRNAALYGDEVCLVGVNPEVNEKREITWREYELMETNPFQHSRREMTWRQFDRAANRFANLLLSRGIGKNAKVTILLMNCLEWSILRLTPRRAVSIQLVSPHPSPATTGP